MRYLEEGQPKKRLMGVETFGFEAFED